MRDGIWIRCQHCGVPHPRVLGKCPTTGRPIARTRRISRKAESELELPHFPESAEDSVLPRLPGVSSSLRSSATHSVDSTLSGPGPQRRRSRKAPSAIAPGDILENKYEVLRLVGSGAMGSVFECNSMALRRRVAVKVLHPETAADSVLMRRFRREARIAGALGHRNICRTYDVGETHDGIPFVVMELLKGVSLAQHLLQHEQLSFEDTLHIAHQILAALAAAHAVGVIHRDIKPANVFVDNALQVKLIDFGISKATTELTQLTRVGHLIGTPAYMAPEQTAGVRVDHRIDLYASGVVMYECITGQRPFEARTLEELIDKVRRGLFPSLRLLRPDVPAAIEHVVLHAMQPRAEKRPASATEMASAISQAITLLEPPSAPPASVAIELDDSSLVDELVDDGDDDDPTEVRGPAPD